MTRPTASTLAASALLSLALLSPLNAHAANPSEASLGLSMLPVAVSVIAPAAVLSAGGAFVVVSVETTAKGTVWVLKRASDGVRVTLEFSGKVVTNAALSAGTAVVVSAIATGYVVSAAAEAIAFIPNAVGAALLHNERVTDKDRVVR